MGAKVGEPAGSGVAAVGAEEAVELHLVLEGERGGLPVFCCDTPLIRVDGRAIPARLVVSPEDAGLSDVHIRWMQLTPTPDAKSWRESDLRLQQGDWSLPVLDLPGRPAEGIDPSVGTARFSAALSFLDAAGRRVQFDTEGHLPRTEWKDPRLAPGFRVTRNAGDTLPGRAARLARLPVVPGVEPAFVRALVALRPADPFLAAYDDLAESPWPDSVRTDLTDPSWSWLLAPVALGHKRDGARTAAVGRDGHGIPWRKTDDSTGVARGDVVFCGGYAGFLESDDGDWWLGNGDRILSGATGTVAFGPLRDLPAGPLTILRPRDFRDLVARLNQAGYGPIPLEMVWTDRARRALASFQEDQGLPKTGDPDEATRARLAGVLDRMRSADPGAPPDSAR